MRPLCVRSGHSATELTHRPPNALNGPQGGRYRSRMSSIDEQAEYAAARAAFVVNADYREGAGSTAKAEAFCTACRRLMLLQHVSAAKGGPAAASETISVESIQRELRAAESWLASHSGASSVDDPSEVAPAFTDFRGELESR